MSGNAQSALERGKAHYDAGKFAEAVGDFSEAVRLNPQNATYHAWLARAFNRQQDYARAIEEANCAVELDATCALAYRQRGYAYELSQQDYDRALADYSEAIRLDPGDDLAYAYRGDTLLSQGRLDEAVSDLSEAARLDPHNVQRHLWLAYACNEQENYIKAMEEANRAIELDSTCALAYLYRGMAHQFGQQDYDRAIADYNEVTRLDPENSLAYAYRGNLLGDQGRLDESASNLSEATRLDPHNADYHAWLARTFAEQKNYTGALEEANCAIKIDPTNAWAYFQRGIAYAMGDQDPDRALADYSEAIRLDPLDSVAYTWRGELSRSQGRLDEAEGDLSEAVRLDPHNAEYHARLARVSNDRQKYGRALEEASRAIELDSACALAYLQRGFAYQWGQDDSDRAFADYSEAIRLDPCESFGYVCRGDLLFSQGRLDEAEGDLSEAVRLDPHNAEYHARLARVSNDRQKYGRALEEASRAIELDSACALAYLQRGYAYQWGQHDFDRAFADYSEAIRLGPRESSGYVCRGDLLSSQGRLDEALADLTEAIRLDPHDGYALWRRAQTYDAAHDVQNAIADRARYYSIIPKEEYVDPEERFSPWYQAIHRHFTDILLPQAENAGERFIEYWPCYFVWDRSVQTRVFDGTSYTHRYCTYGSGYLCLTDQSVRIVSLGALSERFPLYSGGVVLGILSRIAREHDRLETEDRVWAIPYQSVSGAQTIESYIDLRTPAKAWEIHALFRASLPIILTGINMGMAGKLTGIWSPPQADASAPSSAGVLDLLKRLSELKEAGIITEVEFEGKKRELLSRL